MRYVCPICGYVYDEEKEGRAFLEIADNWFCPICGAPGSVFTAETPQVSQMVGDAAEAESSEQISFGEFAALCSNLARGCEKQYQDEEAALYRRLAVYFTSISPKAEGKELADLAAGLRRDLEQHYPALREAAEKVRDRGTLRICVWGEKVTRMLLALVERYQKEGPAFLENTFVWVCTICGFIFIGENPPELCPVCKVPAWKFEKVEGRRSA